MPTFNGTPGNDVLRDSAGDDIINGLAGFDEIVLTSGRDVVDGGTQADRLNLNWAGLTEGVVNFSGTGFDNAAGNAATSVRFTSIEGFNVVTGSGNDTIRTFFRPDQSVDTIVSGTDFINLGAGNDRALGGAGNDTLRGGAGNDVLDGDGAIRGKFGASRNLGDRSFTGADTLFGEAGDDLLQGGGGNDVLDGGIGNDTLYGDGVALTFVETNNGGGTGTVTASDQFGGMDSGNDTLNGGDGNDILEGRLGNDTVNGGAGNDLARFNLTRDGQDTTNLGEGDDTVEISANADAQTSSAIRVTFTSAEVGNGNANDGGVMANQDGGLGVRLQSEGYADDLVGAVSRFDDEGITFTALANERFDVRDLVSGAQRGNLFSTVTLGTSGADINAGSARNDYTNAGMGDDTLAGAGGDDFLVGGGGNDALDGGIGNDSFIGGGGNDAIIGGEGNDRATFTNVLTDGADSVDLGTGANVVSAGITGGGQVRLSFTSAEIGNGSVNDAGTLANQDGGLALRLQAEDSAGVLTGPTSRVSDEGVLFLASAGTTFDIRDLVSGVGRGDQFTWAQLGTSADDVSNGTAGADYFNLGAGNDTANGAAGNDFLVGGGGADTLNGGADNDSFIGGGGNDAINGGDGIDTANYGASAAGATIRLNNGVATDGTGGTDSLTGIENVIGTGFDDTIVGEAGANDLSGGAGRDVLIGLGGNDVLRGGTGVANELYGGTGDDTYVVDVNGDTIIESANQGNDTVNTSLSTYTSLRANVENLSYTGTGDFTGRGNAGDNVVTGGAGAGDLVILSGNRADYTFAATADGYQVIDNVAARDGTDLLNAIENVRFADGSTVALSTLAAPVFGAEAQTLPGLADDDFVMGQDTGPVALPMDGFSDFGGLLSSVSMSGDTPVFLREDPADGMFIPGDTGPALAGHDDWMM